ncbi:MAG: T9SS type B sorting domain-containing protein [Flavobacterium sp. JAD_PAG50586_2]|nr:MAG: T9SS type B sorting domain-containing protein [Flavobacterium sp. JAD_PAG50586_2]
MKKFLNLFLLLFLSNVVFAQEPNDCENALVVCGNGAFSSNSIGMGNFQEINSCGAFESNSIWLEIHIVQGGTLGFDLIPDDPDISVDYDFWVFGPNAVCGVLGSPIRCATTNPDEAGLSSNLTGMNGSTLFTQTGPGGNGNGYVRWLTVTPGQSYFIAIDRPVGDGGFQIQWNGTASGGSGAFPLPPTANSIPDVITCSNTPNVGIFDLSAVSSLINADTTGNTITYHNSLADANDGINALPNIYSNISNPETIFVRVTDNTAGCFAVTEFDLVVNLVPNASVAVSSTSICIGNPVTVTFTGTPNATISYTIDGGSVQTAVLNASGSFTFTESPTLTRTYTLTNVRLLDASGNTICSQSPNQSVVVNVTNATVTPVFNAIAPICNGGALAPLPTLSTNSITGTWSPALDNTTTTTYTFTPDPGQCALPVTTTILVNPSISATVNSSTICGGTATVTATPSIPGIYNYAWTVPSGFPNPGNVASFTTTIAGVYTVVLTQTNSFCNADFDSPVGVPAGGSALVNQTNFPCWATTATDGIIEVWSSGFQSTPSYSGTQFVELNANQVSTLYQNLTVIPGTIATISFAHRGRFSGTDVLQLQIGPVGGPYISLGNFSATPAAWVYNSISYVFPNNGVTNYTIRFASVSSGSGDLTVGNFIDAVSITGLGCSSLPISGTVSIPSAITPTFSPITNICQGSSAPTLPIVSTNNPAITGTWSPATISTATVGTTTYTFTPDPNQCAISTTLNVTIDAPSIIPTFNPIPSICRNGTLSALPTSSTNNPAITGSWSPSLNNTNTTTYTFTPDAGQCALNTTQLTITVIPYTTPTFNPIMPICSGDTLSPLPTTSINGYSGTWSPPLNNTATTIYTFTPDPTQCATSASLTITVIQNVTPSFSAVAPICYGNTLSPLPTTSINGYSGTWSPPLNNTATTTYTFTPNAGQCASTTNLTIIVNPIPLPNPVITDYELCDYTGLVNQEIFDLGTKSAEIANGQTNVTISYYASLLDAQTQNNPLPNLYPNATNPQQIWINIRDNATGCNTTGTFDLIVNPLPVANTPPAIFECSNGTTLTAQFDLTVNEGFVKGGLPGFTISYFRTLAEAQTPFNPILTPTSYTGNEGDVIIIRLQNDATGCYSTTTQLLRVTQGPLAVTPTALQYCDPNNDGFGVFDLDSKILEIQGGTLDPNVTVTFHETPDDAYIGANGLVSPYDNIDPWSQIIYVRVFYTLTGCANYVQLKLNVNPTPEATEPADYELCDYSAPAGVEVFDLTTRIPEILGSINPALTTVTFYTNLPDAQAPSNAIAGITNYLSGNTTLYVRVETTATGCFDIVTLNLVVNPLPNSLQPNYPQYSLCDTDQSSIGYETFNLGSKITDILLGQGGMDVTFWRSLGDAQNRTNEITNLMYENAIPYVQTIGIIITNRTTGCFVISTMDLRVEPLPTPIPPAQPYTICDDNQDGFSCGFDLSTLIPDILQGANYTLTFYETPTDAATANTATDIDPTQPYCNNDPFMQLLYVRAEDNVTHCFTVMPIQLMVDPSPIAPISLNDIVVCDDDNNPQSATKLVDLTQRTPDVLSQQPLPATNYTVTYYTSQLNAETPTGEIIPANSYFGSDGEQIWVRVENNATQCFNTGSFFLVINTPLLLTFPTPLSVCDDDAVPNDQLFIFDLTIKNTEINQGTGFAVDYFPSLLDAQNNTNIITTPTAYLIQTPPVQTLGVVVTTADGCKSITTLDIRVLPIPTPRTNPPALAPKCDDNNPGDMLELFDLTVNEAYIRNGDPNLTFHYFRTQADAENNVNELIPANNALVGSNVWIRVENNRVDYLGNHCYVLVEQALTVNPLPTVIQPLAPYRMCDDNADGLALFDLANPILAPLILGTATTNQQPADYTITYHLTPGNAASGTAPLVSPYPNVTPTTQNIYIRVVNNATGCVNATGVLTLAVEAYATATSPPPFETCDTYADPYDGVYEIDLTQFETAILNGQNPAVFLVSYYRTQAEADAGTNPLTAAEELAYITDPDTDTIWVKVENSSNSITPYCYALAAIVINVERYPNPIINTPNGVTTICVDFVTGAVIRPLTLDSGITNTADYTFEWFEAASPTTVIGSGPTYTVDTPATGGATRSYTVHVASISALGCDTTSAPFDVIQSGPAVIPSGTIGYTVTNAFSNQQIITVIAEGYGTYEYSLDDGPRQTSNVFENVSIGVEHTIHVWDTEGGIAYSCEELIINNVNIIDYPHYFTPNGDGIHDTWNIWGLQGQPAAKIFIFDRYGKLLKQISSKGAGWDGTYNGHLLPSDDYWFTVDFEENSAMRQFKAHFTLKR